jgi:hypothetical protein
VAEASVIALPIANRFPVDFRGNIMKKIFALIALAGLGVATIGCEPKPAATPPADAKVETDTTMPPSDTPPASTPPADAPPAEAPPAEKAP